jgi:hypothetical protein
MKIDTEKKDDRFIYDQPLNRLKDACFWPFYRFDFNKKPRKSLSGAFI